eukprot:2391118-Rhodomonas_salina.2
MSQSMVTASPATSLTQRRSPSPFRPRSPLYNLRSPRRAQPRPSPLSAGPRTRAHQQQQFRLMMRRI